MHLHPFFLLLGTLCLLVKGQSPGAQIRVSQAGIDKVVDSLIDHITKTVQTIPFPDIKEKNVNVHSIVLNEFTISPQNTGVKLLNNGDIYVHVAGIHINLNGDFKAKWKIFHTSGSINAKATDAWFDITFSVVNENGQPRIVNKGVNADLGKLNISVHGSSISWILNLLLDVFNHKIKSLGRNKIVNMLNSKVQHFSDRIAGVKTERALGGKLDGFFVDYGLTSNPSVANSVLNIPVAFQFWYQGHKNEAPAHPSEPYPFGTPWQMACIDLDADLVFGSVTYAYNISDSANLIARHNVLKKLPEEIRDSFQCNCTGDNCLTRYNPALVDACRRGGHVEMKQLGKAQENMFFNESGMFFTITEVGALILVDQAQTEIAMLFNLETSLGVHLFPNVTVDDDWKLKGTLEVFSTTFSVSSSTIGDIDLTTLNDFWSSSIKFLFEGMLDEMLDNGIPLPKQTFANFHNIKVEFSGHFVRLCSDLNINI